MAATSGPGGQTTRARPAVLGAVSVRVAKRGALGHGANLRARECQLRLSGELLAH